MAAKASWPSIKIAAPAKPEIDRYEHQSRPMGNRHRKGPQAQLRRPDPRQRARMTPVQQSEYAEADDKKARPDLNLRPPFGKGHEQREGKQNEEHGEEMADSQRSQRGQKRPRITFHQSGGNGERPAHAGVDAVIEAARNHGKPQSRGGPLVHGHADG